MRILMAHNHYLVRGGEDESTDAEIASLRAAGLEVDLVEEDNRKIAELGRLRTAVSTLWSVSSYRNIYTQLARDHYDIVHVQNFFPLFSPAIHHAASTAGVTVVQTLRNYRLFCLNGFLFRNGAVCEDCLGRALPWPGIRHRCYRGSVSASSTVAAMQVLHRQLKTWQTCVDLFIAPTQFARSKAIEGGLDASRIHVKPNFVVKDPGVGLGEGGYLLFVGRISPEKGLDVLLRALPLVPTPNRPKLKIVGEAPSSARGDTPDTVEWLGKQPLPEVYRLMGAAGAVVVPSTWYETFGRVVIEAYANGTPVIVSNIGALAELVVDGVTGFLFRPGDSIDLADKISRLFNQSDLLGMRRAARMRYEAEYTAARNVEQLLACYKAAITLRTSRPS